METKAIKEKIIQMEIAALEEWNNGNPGPYLDIYADDITYFDPMQHARIDGHKDMEELYASLKGDVKVVSYNMINPEVQVWNQSAVLTFNLVSLDSTGKTWKWNCTEVYRQEDNGEWKIAHNHWSLTRPMEA